MVFDRKQFRGIRLPVRGELILTMIALPDDRAQMVTQICMEANRRSSISGDFGCSVLFREQRNQGVGAQAVSENAQNNRAGDGRG